MSYFLFVNCEYVLQKEFPCLLLRSIKSLNELNLFQFWNSELDLSILFLLQLACYVHDVKKNEFDSKKILSYL